MRFQVGNRVRYVGNMAFKGKVGTVTGVTPDGDENDPVFVTWDGSSGQVSVSPDDLELLDE